MTVLRIIALLAFVASAWFLVELGLTIYRMWGCCGGHLFG